MRKLIIPALAAGLAFLSCKKSLDRLGGNSGQTTNAKGTLSGFWFGSFTSGNEGQVFNSDGTTIAYDFYGTSSTDTSTCPYKGYGTYTLNGDSLHFSVNYPTIGESFTENAAIDTTTKPFTLSGSYTGSQSGSFMLTKQ